MLARRFLAPATLFARCDVENRPSIAVLQKLGAGPVDRELVSEGGRAVVLERWDFWSHRG